ncbi:hypothetical protein OEZ85_014420 [Tetradesmus obliquus]|uniref:Uncharacterized protein n=1 Tax=Tetradesmus obliquus TaxID=3088 RepID=A0ABY8U8L1_TETOB|nr:hypothetical protein OEZ85_014420 [Tetradesmus obliquus]
MAHGKTSCLLVVAVACALLCRAAEASAARKLLLGANEPDLTATTTTTSSSSSSSRQLQQVQSNSFQVIASGQETAAVISRAAESGQLMVILGATTAGNEMARETSDRSRPLSAFDKTSRAAKPTEKESGRLRRP